MGRGWLPLVDLMGEKQIWTKLSAKVKGSLPRRTRPGSSVCSRWLRACEGHVAIRATRWHEPLYALWKGEVLQNREGLVACVVGRRSPSVLAQGSIGRAASACPGGLD